MTTWNPKPLARYNSLQRTGYLAGYSDGYHGYHFGAGYDDPPESYTVGFNEGERDRKNGQKKLAREYGP